MTKRLTAKERRQRRREQRMYGLKKIKKGSKLAWLSAENKNGWSLGLAFGSKTLWLRNLRFASKEEVERVVNGTTSLVLIELKNHKA